MVGRWGMSEEIGFVNVLPADGSNPFLASETSDELRNQVDVAVKTLVDRAHDRVVALLSENRDRLDGLATRLLEKETVDMDEAYEAAGMVAPPAFGTPELTPG